jgi:hypothetical protein
MLSPIPLAPPVTTAVLPLKCFMLCYPRNVGVLQSAGMAVNGTMKGAPA